MAFDFELYKKLSLNLTMNSKNMEYESMFSGSTVFDNVYCIPIHATSEYNNARLVAKAGGYDIVPYNDENTGIAVSFLFIYFFDESKWGSDSTINETKSMYSRTSGGMGMGPIKPFGIDGYFNVNLVRPTDTGARRIAYVNGVPLSSTAFNANMLLVTQYIFGDGTSSWMPYTERYGASSTAYTPFVSGATINYGDGEAERVNGVITWDNLHEVLSRGQITPPEPEATFNFKMYLDGVTYPNIKLVWNGENVPEKCEVVTMAGPAINRYTTTDPDLQIFDLYYKNKNISEWKKGRVISTDKFDDGYMLTTSKEVQGVAYKGLQTTDEYRQKAFFLYVGVFNSDGNFLDYAIFYVNPYMKNSYEEVTPSAHIEQGTGENDDGYAENSESHGTQGEVKSYSVDGLLSTMYVMSVERLKSFSRYLWETSLLEEIKLLNNNPIENILSCKRIPFSISGTDTTIKLGNVTTTVYGKKVLTSGHSFIIGSFTIPSKYGNFLDYSPHTTAQIFLPFIGFRDLPIDMLIGKECTVRYKVDLMSGQCIAEITRGGIMVCEYGGNCGIDIPITANNRATVEASYISSALGFIGSAMSENVLGMLGSIYSASQSKYHTTTKGSYSPQAMAYQTRGCYVIVDRPNYDLPSTYNHDYGRPCFLTKQLGNCSGFTKVSNDVDLSGFSCTEQERAEIKALLTSGVYM